MYCTHTCQYFEWYLQYIGYMQMYFVYNMMILHDQRLFLNIYICTLQWYLFTSSFFFMSDFNSHKIKKQKSGRFTMGQNMGFSAPDFRLVCRVYRSKQNMAPHNDLNIYFQRNQKYSQLSMADRLSRRIENTYIYST